jgi:myosin-5
LIFCVPNKLMLSNLIFILDQTFASATYEKCIDHPRFSSDKRQQASGLFQIFHYAGPVEYSTNSFLDKNKDELPREATDFLLSSSMQLLKELGQRLNDKNTTRSSQKSVGSQFSTQLRELRDEIDKTSPHYVRCLKPNDDLVAGNFVPEVVADQLRAAGVLEAVRVSRIGFPQRYKHDLFIQRYGLLASPSVRKAGKRARSVDYCSMLVQDLLPRVKGSHHTKEK